MITANYNVDRVSMYKQVALEIIKAEQALNVLARVDHTSPDSLDASPSWVPIWDKYTVVAGFWEYVDSNASLRTETQGSINI